MKILRTPDDRFANLSGFPYEPRYVQVRAGDGDELRMAYVEDGPPGADPVLLLHGEPSWGYLYRKMIPVLAGAGHRVVVPDLIGFGRSDKPAAKEDYTYERHVAWTRSLVEQLDLRSCTFFGQDWGGLVGLRVIAEVPDRFERIVVANTGLPTGEGRPTEAFLNWQRFSQTTEQFPVGNMVGGRYGPEIVAAYDAPFPDDSYKSGARIFPALVPTSEDDPAAPANKRVWEFFDTWEKPFLTAFSDSDPVTAGGERVFQRRIPGAQGQPHVTIEGAGHFLQEDKGEELAQVIVDFIAQTS